MVAGKVGSPECIMSDKKKSEQSSGEPKVETEEVARPRWRVGVTVRKVCNKYENDQSTISYSAKS